MGHFFAFQLGHPVGGNGAHFALIITHKIKINTPDIGHSFIHSSSCLIPSFTSFSLFCSFPFSHIHFFPFFYLSVKPVCRNFFLRSLPSLSVALFVFRQQLFFYKFHPPPLQATPSHQLELFALALSSTNTNSPISPHPPPLSFGIFQRMAKANELF